MEMTEEEWRQALRLEIKRRLSAHDMGPATSGRFTCRRCGYQFSEDVEVGDIPFLCRVQ